MSYVYLLAAMLLQSPPSAEPAPPTAANPIPPVAQPAPPASEQQRLAAYLENERRYAERLAGATGQDLRRAWARYVDKEHDKAEERLKGENDPDDAVRPFAVTLEDRYRSRVKLGVTLFAVGFAPLGIGLYTGLTLGEAEPMLGFAGFGGAVIVSGVVVWAVHGVRLRRLRQARARLEAPRVRWQGLAPMYDPRSRTHGLSLGFAF